MNEVASEVGDRLRLIGIKIETFLEQQLPTAEPTSDSTAYRQFAEEWGEEDGSDALRHLRSAVWVTVQVGTDGLRAAYPLIHSGHDGTVSVLRFAVFSVLRQALEAGALVWWLVEQDIGARERLVRSVKFFDYSRSELERGDESFDFPLEGVSARDETIRRFGLTNLEQKLASGKKLGIPGSTTLIEDQFQRHGGGGRWVYSVLSQIAHGSLGGTLTGFRDPVATDQFQDGKHPAVPVGLLAHCSSYAALGVSDSTGLFTEMMGWDIHNLWEQLTPDLTMIFDLAGALKEHL